MKKQRIITLVGVLVLLAILFFAFTFFKKPAEQQVIQGDPIDIVLDFFAEWQEKLKTPETNVYKTELAKSPILSPEVRKKIKNSEKNPEGSVDPVLCQTSPGVILTARTVYEQENEVQIVVTAQDETITNQAIITLLKYNEGWFINSINCSLGEFGEEKEFSFERDGFLLKGSNLASDLNSFNSDIWYLIFEEDGLVGHNAPLFFGTESMCLNKKGKGDVCVPDQFADGTEVSIQGQMSEGGVDVKNLKLTN